jgi:8-oxo-dGTP diphosphatase
MTVYLVRHAVAVGRSEWDGSDDRLRPLTKRGQRQALGLVEALAQADVRRVLSSPALRCADTVAPVAAARGLGVEHDDSLAEGADAEGAVALARKLAGKKGDTVLCTHGDLVPEVLRHLAREGMRWDGELRFAKGSTWVLAFDGDRCVDGQYLPPTD